MAAISPNSPIAPLPLPQPAQSAAAAVDANTNADTPRFADEVERVAERPAERPVERPTRRQRPDRKPVDEAASVDTDPTKTAATEEPHAEAAGGAKEAPSTDGATVAAATPEQPTSDAAVPPVMVPVMVPVIVTAAVSPPPKVSVVAPTAGNQTPAAAMPSEPGSVMPAPTMPAAPVAGPAPVVNPVPASATPPADGPVVVPSAAATPSTAASQQTRTPPPVAGPASTKPATPVATSTAPRSDAPAAATASEPAAPAIEPPAQLPTASRAAEVPPSDAAPSDATGDIRLPAATATAASPTPAGHDAQMKAPGIAEASAAAAPAPAAPEPLAIDPAATPITPQAAAAPAQTAAPATPMPQPAAVAAAPAMQVAVHIARAMDDGTRQFSLRLDPPELGRVDVHVEVDHDGRVAAVVSTDRMDTLDLLQRDARGLERALNDAGLRTDRQGLSFTLRDPSGDGRQPTGRPYADPARWAGADSDDIDAMPARIVATTRALRALDISV